MEGSEISREVERFLFERGLSVGDYFIEQTPVSEMLCYRNKEGRCFDLQMNDEILAKAVFSRLKELGVQIIKLE